MGFASIFYWILRDIPLVFGLHVMTYYCRFNKRGVETIKGQVQKRSWDLWGFVWVPFCHLRCSDPASYSRIHCTLIYTLVILDFSWKFKFPAKKILRKMQGWLEPKFSSFLAGNLNLHGPCCFYEKSRITRVEFSIETRTKCIYLAEQNRAV